MINLDFFAVSARGLEELTARELSLLGAANIRPSFGGVYFSGDLKILYRANLWLRTASRILLPIRTFSAATPAMLYDQVRRIKWDTIFGNPDRTLAVDCVITGAKSGDGGTLSYQNHSIFYKHDRRNQGPPSLSHSHYAALKIKDAIVDQLRLKFGRRPDVDTKNPHLRIHAFLNDRRCTLSLDSSGASLHERGYRQTSAHAPIKETLAAAIVMLTDWEGRRPFLDPMCGSGTLVLEAGLIAINRAPGLFRKHFGFFGWNDFDQSIWNEVYSSAKESEKTNIRTSIVGFDQERLAIAQAIESAKKANLDKVVHFEKRSLDRLEPLGKSGTEAPLGTEAECTAGILVVNPPYGERMGQEDSLKALYSHFGDLLKQRMKGWSAYVLTGNPTLAKSVGLHASRRFVLFNGPIECRLLRYDLYEGSRKPPLGTKLA